MEKKGVVQSKAPEASSSQPRSSSPHNDLSDEGYPDEKVSFVRSLMNVGRLAPKPFKPPSEVD